MRRVFGLLCLISLTVTPVSSEAFIKKNENYFMSPDPRRTDFISQIKEKPQACESTEPKVFNSRSQSNLIQFFNTLACSSVEENILNKNLDSAYCAAVSKCEDYEGEAGNSILTADQKKFLESEALNMLIRVNTKIEMDKYTSADANRFKELLSYIGKMSKEDRKKINGFETFKSGSDNACLGKNANSELIQKHIKHSLDKRTRSQAGFVSESGDGNKNLEAEKQLVQMSKIYYNEKNKNDFSVLLDDLKNQESVNSNMVMANSNDLDPDKDTIVNSVYVNVLKSNSNVLKIPAKELKDIIRESLLNSSMNSNDYIFNYKSKNNSAVIEKALSEIDFSHKDFLGQSGSGRKALALKINQIRISLANSAIKENFGKINSSITQVCSNLTEKIKTGSALDFAVAEYQENPINKLIDYYKNNKSRSQSTHKKDCIEKLEQMRDSKSKAYQKYLSYSLQKHICAHKFSKMDNPTDIEPGLRAIIEDLEKDSEIDRKETIAVLAETAKHSNFFYNEMKSSGIKINIDAPKSELTAVDVAPQPIKAESTHDYSTSSQKDFFAGQAINQNTRAVKSFEPSMSEAFNHFNSAEELKKSDGSNDYGNELRSKLTDLEKKEKIISQKVLQAKSEGSDKSKSDEVDEISKLREQIEDLKKTQNQISESKDVSSQDGDVIPLNNQSSTVFGSKSSSASEASDTRNDVSAGKASVSAGNVSQSGDVGGQSNANAATRASASVGVPGAVAATKGVADKANSGIILSKSGEVMQDPASILDNPKEGEIVNLLEVTNGLPFLIRENGVLMKVTIERDSNGKPQLLSNGKPRYKKERLSKKQEESIAMDTNIQKSMKEVERDPTRLFNLKSLIKETVKRE